MDARVTMQQIADAAGVGKATVSLALRDDPRLRAETRKRIQKVAEELGYRANATVAHLMAQLRASRTPKYQATLGLVNASDRRETLSGLSTFREWTSGCARRAEQLGYGLDEFWLFEPGINSVRLAKILHSRNIRGLIITAILDHTRLPEAFDPIWKTFACVVVGVAITRPPLHAARNNQFSTARSAVHELIKLGYRRPGLVVSRSVDEVVDDCFSAGFWAGQSKLAVKNRVPSLEFEQPDFEKFKKWFEKNRPDSLVCIHEEVKNWVAKMNLRVPADVGLVHLDRPSEMSDWAGMRQNNDLVGMAAVDVLVGQLHRNEAGVPEFPKCVLVESSWVAGGTVRQQP